MNWKTRLRRRMSPFVSASVVMLLLLTLLFIFLRHQDWLYARAERVEALLRQQWPTMNRPVVMPMTGRNKKAQSGNKAQAE